MGDGHLMEHALLGVIRNLSQLIDNLIAAGATPAAGSVTDEVVAADAAIAQSKIAGLVEDLAARATGAELATLGVAVTAALALKAPSTGIAQSAITNLVADLAAKATPAEITAAIAALSGTYVRAVGAVGAAVNAQLPTTKTITVPGALSWIGIVNTAYEAAGGDKGTRFYVLPTGPVTTGLGGAIKIFADDFQNEDGTTPYRDMGLYFHADQNGDKGQHGKGVFWINTKGVRGSYAGRTPDLGFCMEDGSYVGARFVRLPLVHWTTIATGSATVTDPDILAIHQGLAVSGVGIPPATFVGTVTPGVGFLLSSSATSQVNVLATADTAGLQTTMGNATLRMPFIVGSGQPVAATYSPGVRLEVQGDIGFDNVAGRVIRWFGGAAAPAMDNAMTFNQNDLITSIRSTRALMLKQYGGVSLGPTTALATNTTVGFVEFPTMAGTPTGVAVVESNHVAAIMDTGASKMWARFGGVWKSVTFA